MRKFLTFFSLTSSTQVGLALIQLILLPLQLGLWQSALTAEWYAAIALTNLASLSDLGLRSAGHDHLLRLSRQGESEAARQFGEIWSWIRILIVVISAIIAAGDLVSKVLILHQPYQIWRLALISAAALETLLIVRSVYLDTLCFYRLAEGSYLFLVVLRLATAIPALLWWRATPAAIALIWFVSGVAAVAFQHSSRVAPAAVSVFAPLSNLRVRVLFLAGYTITDPFITWIRFSFPVLVLSSVFAPAAVTTFVALRAIFGPARALIQQFSRIASVEYFNLYLDGKVIRANTLLKAFLWAGSLVGSLLGCVVIADNYRVLSLWNSHLNSSTYTLFAGSFSVAVPFMSAQIIAGLKMRGGELRDIAVVQYLYMGASAIIAVTAVEFRSLSFYAAALCAIEIMASAMFFRKSLSGPVSPSASITSRGFIVAALFALPAVALWIIVRFDVANIGVSRQPSAVFLSWLLAFLVLVLAAVPAGIVYFPSSLSRSFRKLTSRSAKSLVVAGVE